MNKFKDVSNEELIRMYNELKEYLEYIDNLKNKLEEQNVRKTAKTN